MEVISKIYYKDKMIYYVDYTAVEDTDEKTIQLLQNVTLEYQILQLPPKSVLALVNITNRQFNIKVVNAFKAEREVTTPFEKKNCCNRYGQPSRSGLQFSYWFKTRRFN